MLNCTVKFECDFPPFAKQGDECQFIDGKLHYKTGWISPNEYESIYEFMEHNPDALMYEIEKKHPVKFCLGALSNTVDLGWKIMAWTLAVMVVAMLMSDALTQFAIWFYTPQDIIAKVILFGSFGLAVLIKLGMWLYHKACN